MHLKSITSGWRIAEGIVALVVLVPLWQILSHAVAPAGPVWEHLRTTLLPELISNTFLLLAGVGSVTLVLGTSLAWLTGACEFPGRKFFAKALLLPFAVPAYVLAFTTLGLLDFSGPVQGALRLVAPDLVRSLPDVRTPGMVIAVLSLAFYPYTYLLARNAFATRGRTAMEAARTLGLGPGRAFFKVVLPMARPWLAAGTMLVLMETMADFGTVSIFNFDTFTLAIYKAWFGFFSLSAAAHLSSILVIFALILVITENSLRKRMRFTQVGRATPSPRIRLSRGAGWAAASLCTMVFALAFACPVLQLMVWAVGAIPTELTARYATMVGTTLTLAGLAAGLVTLTVLVLAYAGRRHDDFFTRTMIRLSTMGYAIPGTVLAVGVVLPTAALDNTVIDAVGTLFGLEIGPVFQGTILIMLGGYLVRFMAAGFNPVHSAMERISPSLDEAARLHGVRGPALLRRVHGPMLKNGLTTAALLVFLDVMKEMPITLMTRPFGWDTLAVKIYELTSEGEWERAALPAVALVLAGLVPVFLLNRSDTTS